MNRATVSVQNLVLRLDVGAFIAVYVSFEADTVVADNMSIVLTHLRSNVDAFAVW